jgi:hypothetical protein
VKARYATPAALKHAIEDRLRSEAMRTGTDMARLRQLIVFERFLARLFQVMGDTVILKGGIVLELRLDEARTTRDIDLRMSGRLDLVLKKLQEAGRLQLGDFLTYEVVPDSRHHVLMAEGMAYAGRRYRAKAHLAGKVYGQRFGVDVAFGEPLVGDPEVIEGTDFLRFAGIPEVRHRVYPLESHIAEKVHAFTLPRTRSNTRVKDLPDLALLGSVRPIASEDLSSALRKTFAHRRTHTLPGELPAPPTAWAAVYERMARESRLPWRTLDDVTAAAKQFLDPVLRGEGGTWRPKRWKWS